ncbi:MAG TPA: glucosidase, partial [Blastocatellia bacterium]
MASRTGPVPQWMLWGPYVSERSWGTVREDYSENQDAWNYLPHDAARSTAYKWGEDGLAGICDRFQLLVFALAFWNGRDPILKERAFGVTPSEGNHGEDVKEYYFYLDNTPTHSYMKYLYKYPQAEFPYRNLVEENQRRAGRGLEYELIDTGIFDQDRYFDIFVEYAKQSPTDLCIRIEAFNRGPEPAPLHLIPHLWFRNTWGADPTQAPTIRRDQQDPTYSSIVAEDSESRLYHQIQFRYKLGKYHLYAEGNPAQLFTN